MKTLIEIQNEVIKEHYSTSFNWNDYNAIAQCSVWPEVCRRAQLECARETLKEASINVSLHEGEIDYRTITDDSNIKLVE